MSKLQIFKCLVSQFIKCSGAGEEGDTSVEAKSEEGWNGGGWVEQQDSQGEGQVRGSQGEGWSEVGFHPEFHHLHHVIVVTLARVCSIKSFIQSYVTTFTAYYHCYMTLSITKSTSFSKLLMFPFSGKRCSKIESGRWRRRRRRTRMIWWSSCRSSRSSWSSWRSSRWRSTWSSSASRWKWPGLPIKISESENTCDQPLRLKY